MQSHPFWPLLPLFIVSKAYTLSSLFTRSLAMTCFAYLHIPDILELPSYQATDSTILQNTTSNFSLLFFACDHFLYLFPCSLVLLMLFTYFQNISLCSLKSAATSSPPTLSSALLLATSFLISYHFLLYISRFLTLFPCR